jgi:hypothetical protein
LTATSIDLDELDKHGAIEHDASLTRKDFSEGDNHSLQPDLIDALLNDAQGDSLTVESLATSRVRRDQESQRNGAQALTAASEQFAYGEAALLLQAMGANDTTTGRFKAPKSAVKTWLLNERLPDGYVAPVTPIGFYTTSTLAANIQYLAETVQG